jgi:prophage regulatory protein
MSDISDGSQRRSRAASTMLGVNAPIRDVQQVGAGRHQLEEGDRLIPMRAVIALTSWSRTSIYRLIDEGAFPAPVKIGKHRIAFAESDIREYVASRLRMRRSDSGQEERAA